MPGGNRGPGAGTTGTTGTTSFTPGRYEPERERRSSNTYSHSSSNRRGSLESEAHRGTDGREGREGRDYTVRGSSFTQRRGSTAGAAHTEGPGGGRAGRVGGSRAGGERAGSGAQASMTGTGAGGRRGSGGLGGRDRHRDGDRDIRQDRQGDRDRDPFDHWDTGDDNMG